MHEYTLTRSVIETAVINSGGAAVTRIALAIGEASGVSGESIELYFDIVAKDTLCADAELTIERIAPKMKCGRCGELFIRKPFSFSCECGGDGAPTDIGREFYVKYIEIADAQHK